jgi:hypothetical protein
MTTAPESGAGANEAVACDDREDRSPSLDTVWRA